MFPIALLRPGDAILYKPSDFVGLLIAVKTWSWTSHVEVYVGEGKSIGARPEGVDLYPLRNDKYASGILRPDAPFNLPQAMRWFNREAKGDKYDVGGLFGFYQPEDKPVPRNPKAEFCSELATMFYRVGGFNPFAPKYPATKISPAQFWQTPVMLQIWP